MKKVFFYTYPPNIHTMYLDLIQDPPEGYEIIKEKKEFVKGIYDLNKKSWVQALNAAVIKKIINTSAIKDKYYKIRRIPQHDLLFSTGHLCLRKEPWVLDLPEHITSLTGYNRHLLDRKKKQIERVLASEHCKAIIAPTQTVASTVTARYNDHRIHEKIVIIPYAIKAPAHIQKESHRKTIFLFIGSANIQTFGAFFIKGGRITIEAFNRLNRDDCELWIVSAMPEHERRLCEKNPNIKTYPVLPREEIFKMYLQADALVQPTFLTPAMGFLEAFAFALPVITIKSHMNHELVKHMETGIVADANPSLDLYFNDAVQDHVNTLAEHYNHDEFTINKYVDALQFAAEHRAEMQKMGENARKLTRNGPYSYEYKKKELKKVFDHATDSSHRS